MLGCMRTSVDIPDLLMARARRAMRQRGVTLRELVIDGLRRSLEDSNKPTRFVLRDAAWRGPKGFAPGVTAEDLPRLMREMNDEWRRS